MKVNIVIREGDLGWILGRLAKELHKYLGWTINTPGADVDYCIAYYQYGAAKAPIKVPLFTHLEKDGAKRQTFIDVAKRAKYSIALSSQTERLVRQHQIVGSLNPKVIHLGSDLNRDVVFGIVGKNYPTGRKNLAWVSILGHEFTILYDSLSGDKEERYKFYSKIDYLVVTSSIEGGPVPVLDAIAVGVPVIAPDVGWCHDYPCIKYEIGNLKSLQEVMRKLDTPRTWEQVALDHLKAFKEIV